MTDSSFLRLPVWLPPPPGAVREASINNIRFISLSMNTNKNMKKESYR